MRKSDIVELNDNGRTLRFEITQMPATKLHDWLLRAAQCAGGAINIDSGNINADLGKTLIQNGPQILRGIDYDKAKILINEMLGTATRIVDNTTRQPVVPETLDGYIEDVLTLFRLEKECFRVNLGFFLDVLRSDTQTAEQKAAAPSRSPIRMSQQ